MRKRTLSGEVSYQEEHPDTDDDAGWFDRCMVAERNLAESKKRVAALETHINDHVGHLGICDSADDDGESLVCGSDKCSYCALVLAVGGLARHE